MTLRSYLRHLDWLLVVAVGAILSIGWSTIRSLGRHDAAVPVSRHLLYVAVGCVIALVASAIDPRLYRRAALPLYGVALLLLVIVLGFAAARGSSRWIPLPGFSLQPSELAKVVLAIVVAAVVARRARERPGSWGTVGAALGLALPPTALVFVQPDLGTSIVFGVIVLAVLVVAGARPTQLLLLAGTAVAIAALVLVVLPDAGVGILRPYQVARLTSFLDPAADTTGAAYQQTQSKTAIGSGGISGGGQGAAASIVDFLPEHHTDFIFAVVGEQRGFVGSALLLALFVVVVWRAIRAVAVARSLYESLLAAGLTGMLVAQVFVNVGMTMGIAPITGIPLPFMTYGGSNTITNLAAVGLLLAVHVRGTIPEPGALARRAERERRRRRRPRRPAAQPTL